MAVRGRVGEPVCIMECASRIVSRHGKGVQRQQGAGRVGAIRKGGCACLAPGCCCFSFALQDRKTGKLQMNYEGGDEEEERGGKRGEIKDRLIV